MKVDCAAHVEHRYPFNQDSFSCVQNIGIDKQIFNSQLQNF